MKETRHARRRKRLGAAGARDFRCFLEGRVAESVTAEQARLPLAMIRRRRDVPVEGGRKDARALQHN
jgi:hypothetical protein